MMLEAIAASMATQTAGYIAVIDGVMNPMTFHVERKRTALAALTIKTGKMVLSTCTDAGCDCEVKVLAENFPDVKIVTVDVTERKA